MVRVLFSGLEDLPVDRASALLLQRHVKTQLELINGLFHDFSVCYVTVSRRSAHVLVDIVLVHSGGAVYGHGDHTNLKLASEYALTQVRTNLRRRMSKLDQPEMSPF